MADINTQIVWTLVRGDGPLVAAAVHDGHELRPEVARLLALSDRERRREEDPYTGTWTGVADTRLVARRSRFEVDLNRPRDEAVYLEPSDAWGLNVWKEPPGPELVRRSLAEYDAFYDAAERLFAEKAERYGRFLVYDLHTYNHRRGGPDAETHAEPTGHPDVNVGTGSLDRERWGPLVDRFIADLRQVDFLGRRLDVRENVVFEGGHFPTWIHETFPDSGCALAIEVKKFFMDEWTGEADDHVIEAVQRSLDATVAGVLKELNELNGLMEPRGSGRSSAP